MAVDCAVELRKQNIACISLWPGAVKTEIIMENIAESYKQNLNDPETQQVMGYLTLARLEAQLRFQATATIV